MPVWEVGFCSLRKSAQSLLPPRSPEGVEAGEELQTGWNSGLGWSSRVPWGEKGHLSESGMEGFGAERRQPRGRPAEETGLGQGEEGQRDLAEGKGMKWGLGDENVGVRHREATGDWERGRDRQIGLGGEREMKAETDLGLRVNVTLRRKRKMLVTPVTLTLWGAVGSGQCDCGHQLRAPGHVHHAWAALRSWHVSLCRWRLLSALSLLSHRMDKVGSVVAVGTSW